MHLSTVFEAEINSCQEMEETKRGDLETMRRKLRDVCCLQGSSIFLEDSRFFFFFFLIVVWKTWGFIFKLCTDAMIAGFGNRDTGRKER